MFATGRPNPIPEIPSAFVIDRDSSIRDWMTSLIRDAGWQPRTAASVEEFLAAPRPNAANCLIAELDLPGFRGLELQRLICGREDTPLILISAGNDVPAIVQAMKAGAFEFLQKPLAAQPLLAAVKSALERSGTARGHQARIRGLNDRYQLLSAREREVMDLVISGRLNKQVGEELGITEITVKVHRGKLMRKMQAGSIAELVSMALCISRPFRFADGPRWAASGAPHPTTAKSLSEVVRIPSYKHPHWLPLAS